jgi:signal peptidase II
LKKLFQNRYFPFIAVLCVLLSDGLSKYFTQLYIPLMHRYGFWYPYGGIPIFKNFFGIEFSISHQINNGAAWGMLASYQIPLLYFRILLISFLILYACLFNRRPEQTLPFALIIAGALGNVLDFFFYGHVVDMLHFVFWGYDFPVFNLADSSIFIGIAALLLLETLEKRKRA